MSCAGSSNTRRTAEEAPEQFTELRSGSVWEIGASSGSSLAPSLLPEDRVAAARANLILLVDDDADFRDALTIALEAAGYTVVAAADGQEALDRLRAGVEPNLIVLDLTMPRKGGERFRADQVADPKVATVPVILMSGEERLPEKARGLGVDMWVQKPFAANELLGLIARSSAP